MTTMASVPFPKGPSWVQPLATAPLNDTPSPSTTYSRTRPTDTRRRTETSYAALPLPRPQQQLTRSQTGLQRKAFSNESRQKDDGSSGFSSTVECDVRRVTTEFPSYESFQKLHTAKARDDRSLQRPSPFRRRTSGDSSEEDASDGESVPYARRPVLDRPRPRSTHFVDFDDAQLSFQRRDRIDNRLRRQSTRRSLELGRFRFREKEDEGVSKIVHTTPSNTDSDEGRRRPQTPLESAGRNVRLKEDLYDELSRGRGMIARRGSEILVRPRDDVIEAKVVLLGSQGVGKTCLAKRYTEGVFSAQPATVNASLFTRKSVHDGVAVRLQIWDTCGEEKHRSLTKLYYRGAHVALILYDITDLQSFEDVRDWITELRNVSDETDIFVVGAKYDLAKAGKRKVDRRYARWKLATWLGVETGENLQYLSEQAGGTPAAMPGSERPQPSDFSSTSAAQNKRNPPLPLLSPRPLQPSKPGAYRLLSLLSIPSMKGSASAVLDDDETDALTSSITLHPGSRIQSGKRANSTSAATSLMTMLMQGSSSAQTISPHKLPTSGSTSGLNLISATSIAPRRKSEDWSMNKAKDDFLRALGNANPQESEATRALKRTSGELLRPYSTNLASSSASIGGIKEYVVDDHNGWGKIILGTGVRIGETSATTGKGVTEIFASLTSQLVAKRQQIRIEQARRAREVIDIANDELNAKSAKGTSKGRTGASCCA
ncbi:hypothetical protein NliqN6_3269 [Naganishia liquefaciens]|uniref:GTP-binding protein n=1 Tax=Naganishia liquefaciens TaxID=104408 RepID=A0A8H3TTF6_9TREE|nr:hypothetical protein NliqN6_3269 [Naganishia liquefaciens]